MALLLLLFLAFVLRLFFKVGLLSESSSEDSEELDELETSDSSFSASLDGYCKLSDIKYLYYDIYADVIVGRTVTAPL